MCATGVSSSVSLCVCLGCHVQFVVFFDCRLVARSEIVVVATYRGLASRSLEVVQASPYLDDPAIAEPK